MKRGPIIVGALVAVTALSALAWQLSGPYPDPRDPYGMVFKFLGCKGEWPSNLPVGVIVKKEASPSPSFFIRDPVDCGLSVKQPTYAINGGKLSLSYTIYAQGDVAACYCEYDSRFTFTHLPASIKATSFVHHEELR